MKRLLPFGPDVTLTIRVIREDIQIMKGSLIVRKLGVRIVYLQFEIFRFRFGVSVLFDNWFKSPADLIEYGLKSGVFSEVEFRRLQEELFEWISPFMRPLNRHPP